MKKWALRIALSLRVLAAPAVAQFVGSSSRRSNIRSSGSHGLRGLFLPRAAVVKLIEMLFAEIKTRQSPNLPERAIDDALELLPTLITECANYFAHAGYARS